VDAANVWHEETFLVGFQLEGASSTAVSFGKVPGYLINSFAMDHRASGGVDYLRVATTNSASWGVVGEGRREALQTDRMGRCVYNCSVSHLYFRIVSIFHNMPSPCLPPPARLGSNDRIIESNHGLTNPQQRFWHIRPGNASCGTSD
jgi:hypothetical protein